MVKNLTLILFLLTSFFGFSQSQNHEKDISLLSIYNEVEVGISNSDFQSIKSLYRFDVDDVTEDSVFIYFSSDDFHLINELGINYRVVEREILIESPKLSSAKAYLSTDFNAYPTYNQYDSIMISFANLYPSIAKLENLGTLTSGHKILALRISKNVNIKEPEPSVLLTSSMHGDELTGYILTLKLIKYLLEGYGTDAEVTAMIDSMDIWINPLANPDGTYYGGDYTVSQAIRYNLSNVNLNRNYHDPDTNAGPHPDGKPYQQETLIFMNLADSVSFDLAVNFHGGAEVCNYPWDTWQRMPADKSWWELVCYQYADSCKAASNHNGYMNQFGTGVTNGYAWYSITGGRQDYMNYFHNCREVTIELSVTKTLPENQLNTHWNYNKRSLIDFIKNANYGVHGFVSDSATGLPVRAKVFVQNHDIDSSFVFSSLNFGDYYRFLDSGYYSLKFSSPGYYPEIIDSVRVDRFATTYLNVALKPIPININHFENKIDLVIFPNPADDFITIILPEKESKYLLKLYDSNGKLLDEKWLQKNSSVITYPVKNLNEGIYFLSLTNSCSEKPKFSKLIIKH